MCFTNCVTVYRWVNRLDRLCKMDTLGPRLQISTKSCVPNQKRQVPLGLRHIVQIHQINAEGLLLDTQHGPDTPSETGDDNHRLGNHTPTHTHTLMDMRTDLTAVPHAGLGYQFLRR